MATSRDAPNPLRPYYIPPSIGPPPEAATNTTAPSLPSRGPAISSFGTSAREILSDLDYGDYLPETSPTVADMAKRLMDQAIWNYTSVFLAQPFEVSKTILQCHLAAEHVTNSSGSGLDVATRSRPSSYSSGKFAEFPSDDEDSDADSPSYFTSATPKTMEFASPGVRTPEPRKRSPTMESSPTPVPKPSTKQTSHMLELKRNDALFEVLSQLWGKESAWGVWKATNSTFVYNFLLKTIESWTMSMLSALLNVPDLSQSSMRSGIGLLDIVESPSPLASLAVAVAAAGVAGLALAPLDLVRTRLIISPISSTPRAILPSLRSLPSLTVPSVLVPITALHSMLPTLFSTGMPLFLRNNLHVDPILTPASYSVTTFLSSVAELFIRLPLETVLRRAQVSILHANEDARVTELQREAYTSFRSPLPRSPTRQEDDPESFRTIVDVGPYKGVLGTMWFIVREEGSSVVPPPVSQMKAAVPSKLPLKPKVRKGQGIHGLWRGWRVGFWGLVGVWSADALGGRGGGEF